MHPASQQRGRVTAVALLLALLAGVRASAVVKYAPHAVDARRIRALVSEAAQRAAAYESDRDSKAWFDRRAADEGFPWLSSEALHWQRVDRGTVHVGLSWTVQVEHLLVGKQDLGFSWYCTATEDRCTQFQPTWDEEAR